MPFDVHAYAMDYPHRVLRVARASNWNWHVNWNVRTLAIAAAALWASVDFVQWRRVEGGFPLNPLVWALSHVSQYTLAARWATERFARKLAAHKDMTRKLEDLPQRVGPKPTTVNW
ncbi:hypothetical protein AURDEDRAFT_128448 [Auricularia subglabra TFB-10046 SS5]|nr:hypothetical protein AURDEDRAFT_128448 [Auricularia subglabra TFB-10046 SS5]